MRIYVFKRQWWTTAGCLCVAAAMFWVVSHPGVIGAAATQRELPIYSVEEPEEEKLVAISFDAAWGDVKLRRIKPPAQKCQAACFMSKEVGEVEVRKR